MTNSKKEMILITGGSGFVGKRITKKLLDAKYRIVLLSKNKIDTTIYNNHNIYNELYDTNDLDFSWLFDKYKIKTILHMASLTDKMCNYSDAIDANIRFPMSLLLYAIQHNVRNFVNMDTTFYNSEINSYSLSKKHFSECLHLKKEEIKIINLKIDNIYGEEDNHTRFIPMIINSLLNCVKELNLTKGEQKRDFIYIDDVVELIFNIIQNLDNFNKGFYEYGVGSGEEISIKNLVLLIDKIIDKNTTNLKFGAIGYNSSDEPELCSKVNISNTVKDFNWKPKVLLQNGLEKVIAYYEDNENA